MTELGRRVNGQPRGAGSGGPAGLLRSAPAGTLVMARPRPSRSRDLRESRMGQTLSVWIPPRRASTGGGGSGDRARGARSWEPVFSSGWEIANVPLSFENYRSYMAAVES